MKPNHEQKQLRYTEQTDLVTYLTGITDGISMVLDGLSEPYLSSAEKLIDRLEKLRIKHASELAAIAERREARVSTALRRPKH